MKEYKIKITGEYDVIVLSPKMIALLIERIRGSDTKELVIPADEIIPPGYAGYLNHVLEANLGIAKLLPDRNAYGLIADQIKNLKCDEYDCFERVEIIKPEGFPQLDMDTSSDFYIVTKQENCQFCYVVRTDDEEISVLLEYQ